MHMPEDAELQIYNAVTPSYAERYLVLSPDCNTIH